MLITLNYVVTDMDKTYIAIDLKSFYASVECVERGLDPLTTNLVVADESRTEKTICLAVSPSLKSYGISGRARLFEVVQQVKNVNNQRLRYAPSHKFVSESYDNTEVQADRSVALSYLVAKPRMAYYMQYSTKIYQIYLKYVAPEDIHVYSIDEVFIDATGYLRTMKMSAHDFAMLLIRDVLKTTGITATAGIGTNMYLSKIAMDVMAKKMKPDKDGVRIAALDEMSYRRELWTHKPITDFWRVGKGYANKLAENGMFTMGDVARCSVRNEEKLYKLFGVNAELLIDHAWGWEPCTIAEIKAYKPENNSISSGQVLQSPYTFEKARLIVQEMTDLLVLDLVDKRLVTDQIVLTVGYDIESLSNPKISAKYKGKVETDRYGRKVPKSAHGSINLGKHTSSTKLIVNSTLELYNRIVNNNLLIRRMYVVANHIVPEDSIDTQSSSEQLDLFTDYAEVEKKREQERKDEQRERNEQEAILNIQHRFGKNAILKGMNFLDGATTKDRNNQIGGHKK